MNEKRDCNLDWIRVLAMVGVVADHYMMNSGSRALSYCGLQLGGGCVTMFFVISALLFGTKWATDNYSSFQPIKFLKKRCVRLFIPLWISLLLIIPVEYVITHRFIPSAILINAIGLNWARPFGTAGHLWYITMLMALYVCFVGISRLRLDKIKWYWWLGTFAALVISYLMFQVKLTTYSKSGPPLFTFFSVLMFAKGRVVLEVAKKNRLLILVVTIAMVTVSQSVYQLGWHDSHKALAIGSFICAGFLTFLTLYSYLNVTKPNKAISWFAGISYEIYLLHLPLMAICGYLISNMALWAPISITSTIAGSLLLNKLSNTIITKI